MPRGSVSAYTVFVIFLAEEQWFSLGSAFLIIDTLWYGEGLVSALAF